MSSLFRKGKTLVITYQKVEQEDEKMEIVVLLLISILSISMIVKKKNINVQKSEQKVKWERYDAGSIKELHYLDEEKGVISFRASKNFITYSGWASIGDRY